MLEKVFNFYKKSPDDDVVLSTYARLARNLSSFPFPVKYFQNDLEKMTDIFSNAFQNLEYDEKFHYLNYFLYKPEYLKTICERGFMKYPQIRNNSIFLNSTGMFVSDSLKVHAEINCIDHIHIISAANGYKIKELYENCSSLDKALQKNLEFAFSKEFGYLSSFLYNTGTGLKLSARFHIPAIVFNKKQNELNDIIKNHNLVLLEPSEKNPFFNFNSGSFCTVATHSLFQSSEIEQLADFESASKKIINLERKNVCDLSDNKKTVCLNTVRQAFALSKAAIFMPLKFAANIVSDLLFGLKLNFLGGMQFYELQNLLYFIQDGHIELLSKDKDLTFFEEDIKDNPKMVRDRFRAVLVHNLTKSLRLNEI